MHPRSLRISPDAASRQMCVGSYEESYQKSVAGWPTPNAGEKLSIYNKAKAAIYAIHIAFTWRSIIGGGHPLVTN